MRELMRELLSANLFVTGILIFIASIIVFYGAIYLLAYTNLGKKLAFLITGAGVSGWMAINSLLFVLYSPRGPRPENIEGLNAFEIRIIPLTYLIVSIIVFAAFMVGLKQYEEIQARSA
ncbi:MAG TPA: sugar transferase [Acidimicrobiia bacterium]|nr:sugar transferase [Acidimicrobiia bacterium]